MNKLINVTFLLCVSLFCLASCDRAQSNIIVMQTTDCGKSWVRIETGQRIPSTAGNICGYNTELPDYPMQGETIFKTKFKDNVIVDVTISYDYEITDPTLFLRNAKFLGKMKASSTGNSDANADSTGTSAFEIAENTVIDVRIKEVTTENTQIEDIVVLDSAKFEDKLFKLLNEILATRGITLNSMTFVLQPEEQTRIAIDAATAMKIYEAKGLVEFGQKIAIAKAGAPKIVVNK